MSILNADLLDAQSETQLADATAENLERIIAVTESLFDGSQVSVRKCSDPDSPADVHVVFTVVQLNVDVAREIEKRLQWHQFVQAIAPSARGKFRLAIE